MAQRNLLHVNKLEDFEQWRINDGWSIEKPVSCWEVLRAFKADRKHPVIIYSRLDSNKGTPITHYSVRSMDAPVVRAYLRDNRKKKDIKAQTGMTVGELVTNLSAVKGFIDIQPTDNLFNDSEKNTASEALSAAITVLKRLC